MVFLSFSILLDFSFFSSRNRHKSKANGWGWVSDWWVPQISMCLPMGRAVFSGLRQGLCLCIAIMLPGNADVTNRPLRIQSAAVRSLALASDISGLSPNCRLQLCNLRTRCVPSLLWTLLRSKWRKTTLLDSLVSFAKRIHPAHVGLQCLPSSRVKTH